MTFEEWSLDNYEKENLNEDSIRGAEIVWIMKQKENGILNSKISHLEEYYERILEKKNYEIERLFNVILKLGEM